MKLRRILSVVVFTLMAFQSQATHLMGGEIIWECRPNGKYRFTLVLYRDCGGISLPTSSQTLGTNCGTAITCNYVTTVDVVPSCYTGTTSCAGATSGSGKMQKYIYRSGDVQLTGTPPASGWYFTWSSCCRPTSISNINSPSSASYLLRAVMYPYTPAGSTSPLTATTGGNPTCFDNSPNFLEDPQVISCTGVDVVYNNLGYDPDLDSLYYDWSYPWAATSFSSNPASNSVNFASGYTYNNPMPSTGSSTGADINNETGEITFNSAVAGSWATCVKIEEWRCGQLIGEIYRDIPIVTMACTPPTGLCSSTFVSSPPAVTFTPLIGPAPTPSNNSSNDTVWSIYCNLNDTIAFSLSSSDPYANPNCSSQNISFEGSGIILSLDTVYQQDTTIIGATAAKVHSLSPGGGFSYPGILGVNFGLRIDSTHLQSTPYCSSNQIKYPFKFSFLDDECPIPQRTDILVNVYVNSSTPALPQTNGCFVQNSTNNELKWSPSLDTGTAWGFYLIESFNANGNILATDTLYNWNDSVFIDTVNFNQAKTYELSVFNASGFSNGAVAVFSSTTGSLAVSSIYYNPPNYITAVATGGSEYFWSADKPIFIDNVKNDSVQIALLTDSTTLHIQADNGISCLYQNSILLRDTSTSICDVYDTTYISVYDTTYITQIDTVNLTVTDTLIIDVSLIGINPPIFEYQVLLYPNPTNNYLYVEVPQNMTSQSYSMEIKNSLGQSIFGVAMDKPLITINFNSFGSAGAYTLSVKDSGGNVVDTRIILLQ